MAPTALIVGAGSGISASFARRLRSEGYELALIARDPAKLSDLAGETNAQTFACDATRIDELLSVFTELDRQNADLDVVLYNASARADGPITELDPPTSRSSLNISAYGGFLVGQQAASRMVPRGTGNILFTGASASVKGYPNSSIFAMGKHGLRGLASAMGRELAPAGRARPPLRHRRRRPQCRQGPRTAAPATPPTNTCAPTPSPRPTCTSSNRTAPPGPGKSNSAPRSRSFKATSHPYRVRRPVV